MFEIASNERRTFGPEPMDKVEELLLGRPEAGES